MWTWTYVHVPLFAKTDSTVAGYGVGQVDLPEGPRIQGILSGGPDDFSIGMEMELDLELLGPDRDGDDVVIFRFRPVTAPVDGQQR
ncbi:MAG: OB-fold domain-containing protein [Acidimicrobiales bacterium]